MNTPVEALHQLFHDEWEARLKFDPLFATSTGDRRYNDRLPRVREEDYASFQAELNGFRSLAAFVRLGLERYPHALGQIL